MGVSGFLGAGFLKGSAASGGSGCSWGSRAGFLASVAWLRWCLRRWFLRMKFLS